MKWIYTLSGLLVLVGGIGIVVMMNVSSEPVAITDSVKTRVLEQQSSKQNSYTNEVVANQGQSKASGLPNLNTRQLPADVLNQAIKLNGKPLELSEALIQSMRQDDQGLEEQVLSDGTKQVFLQGRFHQPQTVTITDDGQIKIDHF